NRIIEAAPVYVLYNIIAYLPKKLYLPIIIELRDSAPSRANLRQHFKEHGCELLTLGYSLWQLELRTKKVSRHINEILQARNIDLIHTHGYHPDLVAANLHGEYRRISTQHNIAGDSFPIVKGKLIGSYMTHRLLSQLSRMQAVVGITQSTTNYYKKRLGTAVHTYTVSNGIDPQRFGQMENVDTKAECRKKLGLSNSTTVLVAVGLYTSLKNQPTLIRAVGLLNSSKRISDDHLIIFLGSGIMQERCRSLAQSLGVRVRFDGLVSNMPEYFRAADMHVTASLTEGFGLTVVEAIAMRCTVVSSAIPAFEEITERLPSIKPLHFEPTDVEACALAIEKALDYQFDEIEAQDFTRYYSAPRMAEEYHKLYQQLEKGQIEEAEK
ncbi:glycosyltransferase family 4 protein, partial [Porphyromonas crevioricanis]